MSDGITVITATGDRPIGLRLACEWMKRQIYHGALQWIIVDDSSKDWVPFVDAVMAKHYPSAQVIHRTCVPKEFGPISLAKNLSLGLAFAVFDKIVFWEDDDIYLPHHLTYMNVALELGHHLVGNDQQLYYHWPTKTYKLYKNIGSALCSTALRLSQVQTILEAAIKVGLDGKKDIDGNLWKMAWRAKVPNVVYSSNYSVVGLKGLPGRAGIGIGHKHPAFKADERNYSTLRSWADDYTVDTIKKVLGE
jgi:hypothetical protein